MANPDWWLRKALIAHDALSSAAADAGLDVQDLSTGVTGGIEAAPDYVVSGLSRDSGVRASTDGAGVDDAGFNAYRDGALSALQ